MSLSKQFNRTLDDLWHRRTAELRALVVPRGQGQPLKFTKAIRRKHTDSLLAQATRILLKREGKKEFDRVVECRRLRKVRGRGLDERFNRLIEWAEQKCSGPIVYVFWKRKKCLYAGKGTSWRRLRHYKKSAYLLQATDLEVFCISGKSQLPKAECLATHLFRPRDYEIRPARKRWGKACPICKKHDAVQESLTALFKMK
jgi:hypothetical protein